MTNIAARVFVTIAAVLFFGLPKKAYLCSLTCYFHEERHVAEVAEVAVGLYCLLQ